jgi:hypothetical protein
VCTLQVALHTTPRYRHSPPWTLWSLIDRLASDCLLLHAAPLAGPIEAQQSFSLLCTGLFLVKSRPDSQAGRVDYYYDA